MKICPFRKVIRHEYEYISPNRDSLDYSIEDFGECLGEKCPLYMKDSDSVYCFRIKSMGVK